MNGILRATFLEVEVRAPADGQRMVEGIVVPWEETTFLTEHRAGERFLPGSLTQSVAQRGNRIKLFVGHDHSRAVGRAVGWNPDDDRGLWGSFQIRSGEEGDRVLLDVAEGMADAFSVGFRPIRDRRADDGAREIIEAALHEVSLLPVGAYDGAQVLAMRGPREARDFTPAPMPPVNLDPIPLLPRG